MKSLKLAVWIIALILLQTVTAHYIKIAAVSPVFMLPFAVSLMLFEESFAHASAEGAIIGLCSGVFMGEDFFLTAVVMIAAAFAVYSFKRRPRYVHNIFKTVFWTALFSFVWAILYFMIQYRVSMNFKEFLYPYITVSVIYNSVIAVIIYPLLGRTLYGKNEKKKLII